MKRLVIGTVSFLVLYTAAASSVNAQSLNSAPPSTQTTVGATEIRSFSPFELVNFAYRGSLKQQGISGYNVLLSDYRRGKIDAKSVVKAGITAGRVSPNALSNQKYLNAVNSHLQFFKAN